MKLSFESFAQYELDDMQVKQVERMKEEQYKKIMGDAIFSEEHYDAKICITVHPAFSKPFFTKRPVEHMNSALMSFKLAKS